MIRCRWEHRQLGQEHGDNVCRAIMISIITIIRIIMIIVIIIIILIMIMIIIHNSR